jgi:hypothetical protein
MSQRGCGKAVHAEPEIKTPQVSRAPLLIFVLLSLDVIV